MLVDGIQLIEGSDIANLTVASGTSFPASPATGELFYKTTATAGLYVYDGSGWVSAGSGAVTSVAVSGGSTGLTTSGGPITSSGTITLSGTLAVTNGGTGQTSATAAFNALAPSQSTNSGKYLTTDGTNTSWATVSVTPGGSNTHVQYNNSGAFAGSSTFTFTSGTRTLQLGDGTGLSVFRTANASSGANAASLTIQTGNANDGVVAAGLLTLVGGSATTGGAGDVAITGGAASGSGTGGNVSISGGTSVTGTPGIVSISTSGTKRIDFLPGGAWSVGTAGTNTGTSGQVLTSNGSGSAPTWQTNPSGSGTVSSVSVVSANGFAGSVATATSTPAITISTSVTGILKGNGTSVAAAVAGDFPTLNQNTTGSAATLTTARTINGTSFDGSANITVTAAAGTLTGTTLNSTVVNSSLTSIGTLSSLNVTNLVSAGGFVGPLTGNASTATTLQTARTINGVSFNGSSNITVTADASTLTSSTLAAGVTASSLTSVGNLTSLTMNGNLGFLGNGRRLRGDFSDATVSNRLTFQTTITDGSTLIAAIPNGTSSIANFTAINSSDANNGGYLALTAGSSDVHLNSSNYGTGTTLPMIFQIDAVDALTIDTSLNVIVGDGGVATTATDGFLYIPACAGTPTGTATAVSGRVPLVIDVTNNRFYFRTNSTWRAVYQNGVGSAATLATPRTINGVSFDGSANITVSAPTLTTARTINGVSFDGSANITVPAAALTLTGTTLNSGVVTSSLTSVGTISSGTWNGTAVGVAYGGTGQTTANAGFNALAPSQSTESGKYLRTNGTDTSWQYVNAADLDGTTLPSGVTLSSLQSLGTVTVGTWNATTISIAKGGTGQTTASGAINALVPTQTSNSGKFLTTDGTSVSWAASASNLTATYIGYGSASNLETGTPNFTWTNASNYMQLGAGTGISTIGTANAVSGANAASLTIQTGNGNANTVGAGALTLQGGQGATGVAGGSIAINAGIANGGTAGQITMQTAGTTQLTIANTGAATFAGAVSGASFSPSGAGVPTNGFYSSASNTLNFSTNNNSRLQITTSAVSTSIPLEAASVFVNSSTAPAAGMYNPGGNVTSGSVIRFTYASAQKWEFGTNALAPVTDNSYSCGITGQKWSVIYSNTGTINTSDVREKNSIVSSDLGLNFINDLNPVSFKFNIGRNDVSEDGLNTVTPVAGTRRHYGLIAQEVQAVLAAMNKNGEDFAGWCLDDPEDANSGQGLRYEQFISPLIKAVQELSAQVVALTARVNTLEGN